jgi:hypothetical protein
MAATTTDDSLEREIAGIGRALDAARPHGRAPLHRAEQSALEWTNRHRELQARLLRLVDVAPACRDDHDLADHVRALLVDGDGGPLLVRGGAHLPDAVLGRAAAGVGRHMA